MRDLDIKTLRLLVTVCDLGSIKDAAAHEHIEPSAISKRIRQLEDAVGTPLLVRHRHGTTPTSAGQALLELARSMLFTADRIDNEMATFRGGMKGHVRLAASPSAIAEALLDDLARFMQQPAHAEIRVNIEECYSRDVTRMVRDGAASLGICWDQVDDTGLVAVPYRHDDLVLAVPASHRLAKARRIAFVDSLGEDHVIMRPASAVNTLLHTTARAAGKRLPTRLVVTNFDAAFRVVASGLGVSVLPRQIGGMYRRAGRIRLIPLTDPWARRRFALFHKANTDLTPATARLIAFLQDAVAACRRHDAVG